MKAIITALLIGLSTAAQAGFKSGNDLFNELSDPSPSHLLPVFAKGYIIGVHDATEGILHCSPRNITVGQVSDLVHQWLRDNPAQRHLPGHLLVIRVLGQTWPCKSDSKQPSSGSNL